MPDRRPLALVLVAGTLALLAGIARTPLWDEDEPRFAAIARTMVETGDWVVPVFNDTLAVDKPVLMHWAMAACMTVFGTNEFAARLPSMIAALVTALALLRLGTRCFDPTVGVIAAFAWLGSLLVGIEAHAATPDVILTALCTWATVLVAEIVSDPAGRSAGKGDIPLFSSTTGGLTRADCTEQHAARERRMSPFLMGEVLPRLGLTRALGVGLLLGLAVVCKGPIGLVGPLAVVVPWSWWLAVDRRIAAQSSVPWLRRLGTATLPAALDVIRSLRPLAIIAGAALAAAPWYAAVWHRTDGAWIEGFFFVHNVGRFMAPMEKHSGGLLFHPLTMLVLFYPWSCFLPLAVVLAAWRTWKRTVPAAEAHALGLGLAWLGVWVGGFSLAATKLPNYVLPAYPAAALLVAIAAVDAARRAAATGRWPHAGWLATGTAALACGGIATAATILVATRYGLSGAEPAALVGLVPVVAAIACWRLAPRRPAAAVACFTGAALVYTAAAIGPGSATIAAANTIPGFVRGLQERDRGPVRLGTYMMASPNVVFYATGHVNQIVHDDAEAARRFLASGADAVLLVPAHRLDRIEPIMPPGFGELDRTRPMFREHDLVAIGKLPAAGVRGTERQADRTDEVTR